MESLDAMIDLLSDGQWHSINEVSTLKPLQHLTMTQIQMMLNLLIEYDFVEVNQRPGYDLTSLIVEAKINPRMLEFWRQIKEVERAP